MCDRGHVDIGGLDAEAREVARRRANARAYYHRRKADPAFLARYRKKRLESYHRCKGKRREGFTYASNAASRAALALAQQMVAECNEREQAKAQRAEAAAALFRKRQRQAAEAARQKYFAEYKERERQEFDRRRWAEDFDSRQR